MRKLRDIEWSFNCKGSKIKILNMGEVQKMNIMVDAIDNVFVPILCGIALIVYMYLVIFGKDGGNCKRIPKSKIISNIGKLKYILIPYAGNNWKWKLPYAVIEIAVVVYLEWEKFEIFGAFTCVVFFTLYVILNVYISLLCKLAKDISSMLDKLTEETALIFVLPLVIFTGQECLIRAQCTGIVYDVGKWLLLLAFLIAYLKFQYILICYVFHDDRLLNENENESDRRLWILMAALLIDISILCSGACVLNQFFNSDSNRSLETTDWIYNVISAFFSLEGNAVGIGGNFGKIYNLLVVIAGVIMFSCFLGYIVGKKKVKPEEDRIHRIAEKKVVVKDEEKEKPEEQGETERHSPRFRKFPSSKLLMDIAIEEYQNEHSRTSVIDTKINIALPIIATYVFLVLDRMNISGYMSKIENNSLSIMDAQLQVGLIMVVVCFAIVSMVCLFMTIKTNEYTILKVEDFYKPEYMALEEDMFCSGVIKYIITASKQNKAVNDSRIKRYKMGLIMIGVSFLFYILYMVTQ